jgi:hypothetical protein
MARRRLGVFTVQLGLMNQIHDRMQPETAVQISNFIG